MNKPSRRDIAKAVTGLIDKGQSSQKIARQLAAYLLAERRTSEVMPLMRDIVDLRAQSGTLEATAISVYPLEQAVKQELKRLAKQAYPRANTVVLHEERDPSLVGGVQLEAGDSRLDLSVHGKLKLLTRK